MEAVIEKYLGRLDEIVGTPGEYFLATDSSERPSVWNIVYRGVPEAGSLTAFTFGLSSVEHPNWTRGRPELVISVNSSDISWGLALGFLVRRLRGMCPFSYGNIAKFGGPVCAESAMSAFLIFAPTILDKDEAHLDLGGLSVNIVQAYPIYDEEIPEIERMGAQKFFMQEAVDFYDVRRKNLGPGKGDAAR